MVRSCSSLFTAIEQQEAGEADGTGTSTGTNRRRLPAANATTSGTSQAPTSRCTVACVPRSAGSGTSR